MLRNSVPIFQIIIDILLLGVYMVLVLITPLTSLFALFTTLIGTFFLVFSLALVFVTPLPTVDKLLFFLVTLLILASGYFFPIVKQSIAMYFEGKKRKE